MLSPIKFNRHADYYEGQGNITSAQPIGENQGPAKAY